jgi:hypothetical protein
MQFTPQDRTKLEEILARSKRIETRLTRYLEAQGMDTGILRPFWQDGKIITPSPAVTLENVAQIVPRSWPIGQPVDVVLADTGEILCQITVP